MNKPRHLLLPSPWHFLVPWRPHEPVKGSEQDRHLAPKERVAQFERFLSSPFNGLLLRGLRAFIVRGREPGS